MQERWIPKEYAHISPFLRNKTRSGVCYGHESSFPHQQKTHVCLPTKVRFLNDVCLRQMMLALPMMTASPNDAWLRHILWQTSHHCGTKWRNIILSEAKNIISPQGDASCINGIEIQSGCGATIEKRIPNSIRNSSRRWIKPSSRAFLVYAVKRVEKSIKIWYNTVR